MRQRNTNIRGGSFSPEEIRQVWEKGRKIQGEDPNIWRRDLCNAKMNRNEYGNTQSTFGWEIDHIVPVADDGPDSMGNLQP